MAFTFFFRDNHVLEQTARHVAPALVGRMRPRVWDAGCATGQEPYSLAIALAQQMGPFAFSNLRIDATDIDESGQFGTIVSAGEYTRQEVQRIDQSIRDRYFEAAGADRCRVIERIRRVVTYRTHDLLSLEPIGSGYSLVVCKNVLLHFRPEQRVAVLRMFHAALAPGGFLVTEQTQKMPDEVCGLFEKVQSDTPLFMKADVLSVRVAA